MHEGNAVFETEKAYGKHRHYLETELGEYFSHVHILRLPALFGHGLKKNFIYDIINPIPKFLTADKFADLREKVILPRFKEIVENNYSYDEAIKMYSYGGALDIKSIAGIDFLACLKELRFTALEFTHPRSSFQYYGLHRLWRDIEKVIKYNLSVMHVAPPPLKASEVYEFLTEDILPINSEATLYEEDMHTQYGKLWGMDGTYISSKSETLSDLKEFYLKNAK